MDENGSAAGSVGGAATEKTFTQDEVNKIVAERLKREREKYADYDELKAKAEQADQSRSAVERLAEQVKRLEERASKAELAALRAEVAEAKGLTAAQAKRLQGTTREELEADADELLALFGQKSGKTGGKDGDKPKDEAGGGTADKAAVDKPDGDKPGDANGGESRSLLRRPKEKLTPGAVPATGDDVDPAKLAESILARDF